MAIYNFVLQSFGYENLVPKFFDDGTPLESKDLNLPQQQARETRHMNTNRRDATKTSWLGTPVFADLILASKDGKTEISLTIVLVQVSQAKIIERTTVRGRRGTVKEYWSLDDYEVKIMGALMSDKPEYFPEEDVQKMVQLLELPESLNVVSRYLQLFDIYELTIKDYNFPPIGDKTNTQLFEITAYSDEPIEFIKEA